jgi:RimJ/RimL family protein N-acetyltransferase
MLKGARVTLTALVHSDLSVMLGWMNDRKQVLSNAPYRPVTEAEHVEWFGEIQRRKDTVIFGIRLLDTEKLIGSCQLHSISPVHRGAELQIRLGEEGQRGKGYGTEALQLLLAFAFGDLNLNRVYLHVFSTNGAALRVYERVGFVREGILRKAVYIDGEYIDVVVMGILRDEYGVKR